jgi:uncharacterized iron-regulated protein
MVCAETRGNEVRMKTPGSVAPLFCACALLFAIASSATAQNLKILDAAGSEHDPDSVLQQLDQKRVVFIGEEHDRYDHHLDELEIIRRLHDRNPQRWVIGVEFIQRPFQPYLDAYVAGQLTEREFLMKTEYFSRWGYDYRLYRPIFLYAKEQGIPIVALNAEEELTKDAGKLGLDKLPAEERQRLPSDIDESDAAYQDRIRKVFEKHPASGAENFQRFWQAQLVWDETMAQTAAEYLEGRPDKNMIVLAGRGHIEFGSGIPNRVKRRLPGASAAILLCTEGSHMQEGEADYWLDSKEQQLPPAGKMGVTMDLSDGVRVKNTTPAGAAAKAGLKAADRIVSIDDQTVRSIADVQLFMLDKEPGQRVSLEVERENPAGKKELSFQLTLQK